MMGLKIAVVGLILYLFFSLLFTYLKDRHPEDENVFVWVLALPACICLCGVPVGLIVWALS